MRDILLEIAEKSARGLKAKKAARPEAELLKAIERRERRPLSLYSALKSKGVSVIAEIKKASPSKGIIKADLDPVSFAKIYSENGAAAISVLTEENYFLGSLDVLKAVREVTDLPLLRKDFIIDRYQVLEAAAAGADALLLIAALLNDKLLKELLGLTHELGLEALCEAHTEEEAKRLTDLGAKVIGVNCRDLRTFQVFPEKSEAVIEVLPKDVAKVAESGLKTPADLKMYPAADAFLIGETLVRSNDPGKALRGFVNAR
ncbi:indole-3-glycerol phosphate synthase TrpC [bacterium]|nr:indole-3-glycerol phosphate synthase TrpC [bacterium]